MKTLTALLLMSLMLTGCGPLPTQMRPVKPGSAVWAKKKAANPAPSKQQPAPSNRLLINEET